MEIFVIIKKAYNIFLEVKMFELRVKFRQSLYDTECLKNDFTAL